MFCPRLIEICDAYILGICILWFLHLVHKWYAPFYEIISSKFIAQTGFCLFSWLSSHPLAFKWMKIYHFYFKKKSMLLFLLIQTVCRYFFFIVHSHSSTSFTYKTNKQKHSENNFLSKTKRRLKTLECNYFFYHFLPTMLGKFWKVLFRLPTSSTFLLSSLCSPNLSHIFSSQYRSLSLSISHSPFLIKQKTIIHKLCFAKQIKVS